MSDLFGPVQRSKATSKPTDLKCVDTNTKDQVKFNYSSRFVLRDIKARKKGNQQMEAKDLFSLMPPLNRFE